MLPAAKLLAHQSTSAHIVIIGAGAAGLAMASRLQRSLSGVRITLVGSRERHFYQPGFTLIGAGLWSQQDVVTDTRDWIPADVAWIEADAIAFDPDSQRISLSTGVRLKYDVLVVATGCQLNYGEIEGMSTDLIGQYGIGSIYAGPEAAAGTSRALEQFMARGKGRAIFTLPNTPIKCAGAPLKAIFTSLSRLEETGLREHFQVDFYTPYRHQVFSVPVYNDFVLRRWREQQVRLQDQRHLSAIDPAARVALFRHADGTTERQEFEFIHIVPPMSAPDAVRQSELVWREGEWAGEWLEVDQYSLQHRRYPEVFGIGDVIGTPFGKTAASVKKQAPVLEENILSYLAGRSLTARYNGYTSCPLITGMGRAMLAEFGYGAELMPSFPFISPIEESWAVWVMKEKMLQPAYYAMLNGRV
ncbi:NAD(P)/FAD-dependent oxidoreductase [Marinobacterium sp. 3-1745]|uniref:NAD(P)/FAD-dependent oxidoreductase n=2 Tax=Marinobacterium marinum TaxID=2756129 RepID=A0A7W1WZE5_9GAMM|nr:NAD(P)/FAD-dependent oxidoreductase [Marinobacterium marinum]